MQHSHCLQENLMQSSPCFSDSLSISNRTTSSWKEKTSATVSYGEWYCLQALLLSMLPFSGRRCVASVRCGRHRTVYRTQWSDKAILITAIFFSLQPIEWFHYIMSLFNPAYTLPDLNVGAMYAEVAAYTKGGNFWEFLIGNVTLGQKASLFWAIGADVSYRLPDFSYSACTSDANSYSSPPNLIWNFG